MSFDVVLRLAESLCGCEMAAQIIEPLVADWQREYRDTPSRRRRTMILLRGGSALLIALALCINPFRGRDGAAARRFAVIVFGFALAATVIQSAPLRFITAHTQVAVAAYDLRWSVLLDAPRYFSAGIALALLPAAILVGARLTRPRLAIVVSMALAAAFVASDVIAPRSERLRRQITIKEMVARLPPAARAAMAANWQRADASHEEERRRDVTGAWARSEYIERNHDAAFAVAAIAFGLLGTAIGRARAAAAAPLRLSVAASWWFAVWMAYQALQFWANRLRIVVPLSIEVAIWLPPCAVLAVAIVALARAGGKAPPLQEAA